MIAWQFAIGITLVTGAYLGLVYIFPGLLTIVFGPEFGPFETIMLPIGVGQLIAAPAAGLILLITAERRGRALVVISTANVAVLMALSITFAWLYGLSGAAWAGAFASTVGLVVVVIAALRGTDRHRPAFTTGDAGVSR